MEPARRGIYIHLEDLFSFLQYEGGKALEQVTQKRGGYLISRSVQGQDRALSNVV